MNAKELYLYATDQATAVVVQVLPGQLRRMTPDAERNVQDLLERMAHELDETAQVVTGADDGPKRRDQDALQGWRAHAVRAERAVERCNEHGVVHLHGHNEAVDDYLWAAGNDQLMHAWDLGQAIGVSVVFDESAAQSLYVRAQSLRRRQRARSGNSYGTLMPVPAGANVQTKLLAAMGRSEDWVETTVQAHAKHR